MAEARQSAAIEQSGAVSGITQERLAKVFQLANAIKSGDIKMVRLLIADRSLVNQKLDPVLTIHGDDAGLTALMFTAMQIKGWGMATAVAAANGVVDASDVIPVEFVDSIKAIAELLIKHGAKVNATTTKGRSALILTVGNRQEIMSEFLIEHGANVNLKDKEGKAPLTYAAINRDTAEIRLLLDHGANPNLQDKLGRTPLMYVTANEDYFAAMQLASLTNMKLKDKRGKTVLDIADESKHPDMANFLRERGAK